ncbi:helix-turn-helix domain-containing protein [Paraburkholderia solisilvae]|uniref:helix-turn-helix domain-containing protein n=1 Tax=Paraburkholderia solisilvae TaxID=624376 RepID=UPI001583048B|nr:helix-turn-helix domain-containing protein [Paraburkholderia solisilvae]
MTDRVTARTTAAPVSSAYSIRSRQPRIVRPFAGPPLECLAHHLKAFNNTPHGAIQEVAYQCGFTSAAHFSRAFRERFGLSPREYAASLKTMSVDVLESGYGSRN